MGISPMLQDNQKFIGDIFQALVIGSSTLHGRQRNTIFLQAVLDLVPLEDLGSLPPVFHPGNPREMDLNPTLVTMMGHRVIDQEPPPRTALKVENHEPPPSSPPPRAPGVVFSEVAIDESMKLEGNQFNRRSHSPRTILWNTIPNTKENFGVFAGLCVIK